MSIEFRGTEFQQRKYKNSLAVISSYLNSANMTLDNLIVSQDCLNNKKLKAFLDTLKEIEQELKLSDKTTEVIPYDDEVIPYDDDLQEKERQERERESKNVNRK